MLKTSRVLVFALLLGVLLGLFAVAPMVAAQDSEPTLTPFPTPITVVVDQEPAPTLVPTAESAATLEPVPESTPVIIVVNPPPDTNPDEQEGGGTFEFFKTILTAVVAFVVGILGGLAVALKVATNLKGDDNTQQTIERVLDFATKVTNNPNLKPSIYATGGGLKDLGEVLQEVSDNKPDVGGLPQATAYNSPITPPRE